jgi:hypothetical protein
LPRIETDPPFKQATGTPTTSDWTEQIQTTFSPAGVSSHSSQGYPLIHLKHFLFRSRVGADQTSLPSSPPQLRRRETQPQPVNTSGPRRPVGQRREPSHTGRGREQGRAGSRRPGSPEVSPSAPGLPASPQPQLDPKLEGPGHHTGQQDGGGGDVQGWDGGVGAASLNVGSPYVLASASLPQRPAWWASLPPLTSPCCPLWPPRTPQCWGSQGPPV